jgi:hypothetical protein
MSAEKVLGWLTAAALLGALYAAITDTDVPEVYLTSKGECVRVLVVEDGREVKKPCSSVDLKHDRYDPVPVYGTEAETQAYAAEIAAELKKQQAAR